MGLGDFWLQSNNGKKYSLKNLKDIKSDDVAKNPKFKKLIEIFNWDSDGDGKISVRNAQRKNEWESVFADLQQAAVDNDLTSEEFGLYISQKSQNADLKLDDVNELLDAATQSTEEVTHANEQSIIDLLIELGVVQQTITEAEFDKIKSDAYNTVLTSATKAEKLDKDYEDLHSFAKEKLSKSGKQLTLQEIVLYAVELQLLNPDIKADKKIKKGTSINLPVKSLDKKKLQLLETKGIKVEKDNYIFFQKLLELDDVKQATVLNTINNSKFKTKEEVINDVYNKTRINLADTGLTIKVGSVSFTLENFITNTLKVDLSSKEGLKIYDRLSRLNQAVLDSLPKEFIVKLSKMNNFTFDKLADKAEVFGIILRTDEEMKEREKNSQAYRDLKARMFMAQYVADNYTSAVTISQSADRNLNFMQGAWWIRNSRPIGYTSNEEQKRDTAKVNQIKKLVQDVDTLSNEEFAKKMSAIMEAERTVRDIDFSLPGDLSLPSYSKIKDPSFKFDPKLAYTFMKQKQRAELAVEAAKRLEPQRKQYVERDPYVISQDNTRVYNAQVELAKIVYTVKPLDKEELKQLTRYIKSIKTKKELFLFAKSLHYKVDVISDKVETMIPKENQAEIQKLLEQKAKELGFAEPTRANSISLDTFRNVFTEPIDKKVNYPKTNDKTIMETYEATKTKFLGNWDPVGEQIRIQKMEGTVGGVLDIATMILVTKGMGSMGAFVRIGNVGRNIGTATNVFKTANVASSFTKNASLINRLAKADKVLGGLWVNGAAGALHGAATMGAYGGLQGTVGMADNTIKNLLEGKEWSEGLGERFEQTLVMGYENAKFGLFAGYSGVLAQALGKSTVTLGSKGIDKLFKTNYSKTVLDKVSSVVTTEGISGSEFFTKMQAASKAEGLVGFGYETGFFTLYHKMEEAGVDFNNEESLLTYVQNNLDEETKQSLGATYLSEAGNLAMFKIIGSLIQWVHIGKLSSGAAVEIQAKNNRALRNMSMRKVIENGKESYLVKFNENDKPIKVAPEPLMRLCEQKMFYSSVEDKAQKDGSFKLPNNQTIEYDKAKKVYRTVIDAENTVESTSVEDLLAKVNQITFKNKIEEQLAKENKVELNGGIVLTKVDGKYQIEITLEDGKKVPVQSEDLNDVIMRAQFVKLVCDAESARKGQRTSNQEEDYPQSVSKDEDVILDIAESENPATVVEEKVRRQWQQHDIETPVSDEKVDLFNLDPNAGLKEPVQNVENKVTSLIFKGKLNETLTQRYDERGKVFTEIAQRRSADIEAIVKANPKNRQAVADGIVKILAQELGMEGFEPPIVFEVAEGNGFFDFMNGEIVIHKNITNVKDLTEVISHEFVHVLQFRDILAQYGEEGIKEIFNNKSIPEHEKEARIKAALNNDYNKRLLQSYNLQRAQSGTVNDYLTRIYKDEFTNTKSAITDMQGYTDQVIEREAYNLGSEHIGNRTEGLSELNINEGLTLAERKAIMEAVQKREQKLASVTSNSTTSNNVLNTNPASIISSSEKLEGTGSNNKVIPSVSIEKSIKISREINPAASRTLDINDPLYDDIPGISKYLHAKIEAQMGVIKPEEISTWADNISNKYNITKQEVLNIMSRLTQFGSYSSLIQFGEKLTDLNIGSFYKESGISANLAYNYICDSKQQFKILGKKRAFILDEAGLKYIEKLTGKELDAFKQKVKDGDIVLINLDGTGLKIGDNYYSYTMLDGNQNLEAMTEAIILQMNKGMSLEDVINSSYKNRVKKLLGEEIASKIENVSISQTEKVDAAKVASQLKPNMPDAKIIEATIEEFAESLGMSIEDTKRFKTLLAKYIDHSVKVNSNDSFMKILKEKYTQIQEKVTELGKTMDDVIYVYPNLEKSYVMVQYMYAKINNVPYDRFVENNGTEALPPGKVIVVLDDVAGSGTSITQGVVGIKNADYGFSYYAAHRNNPNSNIIFAPILCADEGYHFITEQLEEYGNKDLLLTDNSSLTNINDFLNNKLSVEDNDFLFKHIGYLGFDGNMLCTSFPYMIPDNCCDFSGLLLDFCLNSTAAHDANKAPGFVSVYKQRILDRAKR